MSGRTAVRAEHQRRRPTSRGAARGAARRHRPLPALPVPGQEGLPLGVAVLLAVLGGVLLSAAFPRPGVWALAFPGIAATLLALRGRRAGGALLVAGVGGAAFWFTLITWTAEFLGPVPLTALALLQALLNGLGGVLIALAHRFGVRAWPTRWGRIGVVPVVVAAAWTTRETVAGTWPYGGFAWGRVSLSQSTSPFAPLAAWVGLAGLSFLLVWLTAFALACALEPRSRIDAVPLPRWPWSRDDAPIRAAGHRDLATAALPRLLAVTAATGAVLAVPAFPPHVTGSLTIAGVQAVTRSGYFERTAYGGETLDANVRRSIPLLGRNVDLVVWPEGASDLSPLADGGALLKWSEIARLADAPLLAGAITTRGTRTYNSSLLLRPGVGITDVYDKVHPVPFGEYVPDRGFWTPFAPDLIELVGRDYTPGTASPVMSVGGTRVGVDICFDIVDDGLIVGSVRRGAAVLVAQTNNADFGRTEESEQQQAISRLRAIETGRSLMSVSTVASTAAFGPDGRTIGALPSFRPGVLVQAVPTADGVTPAVAFGVPLGAGLAVLGGLVPLGLALFGRSRGRRRA